MSAETKEQELEEAVKKNEAIIKVMSRWIYILNAGYSIENILCDMGCNNVAIYGMGHIGKLLYEQMYGSRVKVSYVIDQNKCDYGIEVPVYTCEDMLPQVNAVIVTPVFYFDKVYGMLEEKLNGATIISFDDILYWN